MSFEELEGGRPSSNDLERAIGTRDRGGGYGSVVSAFTNALFFHPIIRLCDRRCMSRRSSIRPRVGLHVGPSLPEI
jgi:hypothetical protein